MTRPLPDGVRLFLAAFIPLVASRPINPFIRFKFETLPFICLGSRLVSFYRSHGRLLSHFVKDHHCGNHLPPALCVVSLELADVHYLCDSDPKPNWYFRPVTRASPMWHFERPHAHHERDSAGMGCDKQVKLNGAPSLS
ncbi:hypothetical protein C8R45DRAFT_316253 [Mycena sanguinolenta]|nr:hypothetical protein C8R45DRAFT_316253 [Mycena sanguinolenta]